MGSQLWGETMILVWDVRACTLAFNLTLPYDFVEGITFSHDGGLLAAGLTYGPVTSEVAIWNTTTGDLVKQVNVASHCQGPDASNVNSVAFSPDNSLIAVGMWDCEGDAVATVMIFEVATGQLRGDLK